VTATGKSVKRPLLVIYTTVAIEAAGVAILMPILPDLIRAQHGPHDARQVSLLFGAMLALYALMQFVFAPVLGAWSDRYGRRPALIFSLAGSVVNFLIVAYAADVWLLFLGRAIAGFTAVAPVAAAAYIADITPEAGRAGRFGVSQACFGVGFCLGPLLGGVLGDISLREPCLVAAVLSGINLAAVLFFLPESHRPARQPVDWRALNPLASLRWAVTIRALLPLLAVFVLMSLVGQTYGTAWVLFANDRFAWSATEIGLSLGLFGALVALAQTFAVRPLIRRLGERGTLLAGIACEAVALLLLAFAQASWVAFAAIPLVALGGVGLPALRSLQTQAVDAGHQGQLQGVAVSLSSLSAIFGSLFFSWIYALSLPIWNGLVWIVGMGIYAFAVPVVLTMAHRRRGKPMQI
jgi:DHA1 family tetracycline resistance protein-like MFS transporter